MAFEDNGVVIVTRITSSGHMDGIKVLANILVEDMDEDRSVLLQFICEIASGTACIASLPTSSIEALRAFWKVKISARPCVDLAHPALALPIRSRLRPGSSHRRRAPGHWRIRKLPS